jgi:hypothetical protein
VVWVRWYGFGGMGSVVWVRWYGFGDMGSVGLDSDSMVGWRAFF